MEKITVTQTQEPARRVTLQPEKIKALQQYIFKKLITIRTSDAKHKPEARKQGSAAAVTRRILFWHVRRAFGNLPAEYLTDRALRRVFADMILAGYPVGSHSRRGYFLLLDIKDARLARAQAISRLKAAKRTAERILQNFFKSKTKKLFRNPNSPRNIKWFRGFAGGRI